MDKPDLHALAREANDITARIQAFHDQLDEAFNAALGEDGEDGAIEESGDPFECFESAKKQAGEARFAIARIVDTLATVQGYREFTAAEVMGDG